MRFSPVLILSLLAFLLASPILAADTKMGPRVSFSFEEPTWKMVKAPPAEVDRPMYEATLEHSKDPGVSLYLWYQKLKPEEVTFFANKSSEGRVAYMAEMLSKTGTAPAFAPADLKTTGTFVWAHTRITNPSGKVSEDYIAVQTKDDFVLFVVWSHATERAQAPFDASAAEKEFTGFLEKVAIGG